MHVLISFLILGFYLKANFGTWNFEKLSVGVNRASLVVGSCLPWLQNYQENSQNRVTTWQPCQVGSKARFWELKGVLSSLNMWMTLQIKHIYVVTTYHADILWYFSQVYGVVSIHGNIISKLMVRPNQFQTFIMVGYIDSFKISIVIPSTIHMMTLLFVDSSVTP